MYMFLLSQRILEKIKMLDKIIGICWYTEVEMNLVIVTQNIVENIYPN